MVIIKYYLLFTIALNSDPTEKLTLFWAGTLAIVPLGVLTSFAAVCFALNEPNPINLNSFESFNECAIHLKTEFKIVLALVFVHSKSFDKISKIHFYSS